MEKENKEISEKELARRSKISASMQGKNKAPKSEETKRKMSLAKLGKKLPSPDADKDRRRSKEVSEKKSKAMKGKKLNFKDPEKRSKNLSAALKGRKCPNKGKKQNPAWLSNRAKSISKAKTGVKLSEDAKTVRNLKCYSTRKKNNTLGSTKNKAEIKLQNFLTNIFNSKDVEYTYSSTYYPFHCDFYIYSLDLYIELHANPRHGYHPFNPEDEQDLKELERLKNSDKSWDKQILVQWPDLDVRKWDIAIKNNLNIIIIYPHSKETNKIYFNNPNNKPEINELINKLSMFYS